MAFAFAQPLEGLVELVVLEQPGGPVALVAPSSCAFLDFLPCLPFARAESRVVLFGAEPPVGATSSYWAARSWIDEMAGHVGGVGRTVKAQPVWSSTSSWTSTGVAGSGST